MWFVIPKMIINIKKRAIIEAAKLKKNDDGKKKKDESKKDEGDNESESEK